MAKSQLGVNSKLVPHTLHSNPKVESLSIIRIKPENSHERMVFITDEQVHGDITKS